MPVSNGCQVIIVDVSGGRPCSRKGGYDLDSTADGSVEMTYKGALGRYCKQHAQQELKQWNKDAARRCSKDALMRRPRDPFKDPGQDEAGCLQLIEALADGNPIPDTSTIGLNRQQIITLLTEISKGERSELFQNLRQVAERRGLSAQEIGSRAAFLLACLDTPGADDPYTILGVDPTATTEKIKEVWLNRLSLYHPDRHPENSDWFTRHAARLNEAYHTLKDPARRHAYDERRRRELLAQQQNGPIVIRPISPVPLPVQSRSTLLTRHRVPALIAAASVAAAGLGLMVLFDRHPAGPQLYLETDQPMAAVRLPSPTPVNSAPPARLIRGGSPALDAPVTSVLNHQLQPRHLEHVSQIYPPSSFSTDQRDSSGNAIVSERSAADPILLAQALPPIVPEPKALDRQEIDALLDEYIDAYEKADVERVMATLSTKVREKGTLDYQAIRNALLKGFAGRNQIIYRLKNLQVEIKGDQATVTAQYLIAARNAVQSSKGTTVSGRIEWNIHREGDKLKIVAINY
jgi:DnaJ-domain-containing protein 1/ketosteroid isomerase-like protein